MAQNRLVNENEVPKRGRAEGGWRYLWSSRKERGSCAYALSNYAAAKSGGQTPRLRL